MAAIMSAFIWTCYIPMDATKPKLGSEKHSLLEFYKVATKERYLMLLEQGQAEGV